MSNMKRTKTSKCLKQPTPNSYINNVLQQIYPMLIMNTVYKFLLVLQDVNLSALLVANKSPSIGYSFCSGQQNGECINSLLQHIVCDFFVLKNALLYSQFIYCISIIIPKQNQISFKHLYINSVKKIFSKPLNLISVHQM